MHRMPFRPTASPLAPEHADEDEELKSLPSTARSASRRRAPGDLRRRPRDREGHARPHDRLDPRRRHRFVARPGRRRLRHPRLAVVDGTERRMVRPDRYLAGP